MTWWLKQSFELESKMSRAEPPQPVLRLVDQSHHRLVGGNKHAALGILLGDEIHRRRFGQVFLESIHRLVDQRGSVAEEKHALRPVAAHEQIAQRDHRPGRTPAPAMAWLRVRRYA